MCNNDILPFETRNTDVHEGMGQVEQIISISSLEDREIENKSIHEGRCNYCGYDRARKQFHTEVEGIRVECDHCKAVLYMD